MENSELETLKTKYLAVKQEIESLKIELEHYRQNTGLTPQFHVDELTIERDKLQQELDAARTKIEELKEYKWQYEELCK